ncbi:MAG TPA: PKD domain-containing protein [Chitinophagaceae bacterium]|nr:PKD domain-containing protein [Chitinophagaceae bacterium]
MRKYIVAAVLFVFSASNAISQQCLLTAPAAASSWVAGATMTIQWNTGAFSGNVNLTLIDYSINPPSGTVVLSIASNISNSGTYNWTIPNTLPAKCSYGVYIENVTKTNWCYGPSNICITNAAAAQTCNQVEILYQAPDCFERKHQDPGGASGEKSCKEIAVCVGQPYTYSSSVTGGGWTYNWTITGPTTVVINPNNTSAVVNIVWPQIGAYTLTLTATDGGGNVFTYCLNVNVKEKPAANFTFTPNNVCAGSTISFTNTTTFSGGVAYSWNFGDPSSGSNNYNTTSNPTHTYNTAGSYTVTLIAYSFTVIGGGGANEPSPSIKICCADTITKVVTIKPGTLKIECISTVCAGDTATYHAVGCTNPTWVSVTGGTILSQAGDSVTIVWGNGNPQGQVQAQCPGGCIASVPVPIIPTNPVIVGNTSPCNTSTTSYTLPVLPGTFYTWTLTNTSTATNYNNLLNTYPDNNTVWINWALAPPGTYQLTINLDNKHICCISNGSLTINPSDKWTAYYDQTICASAAANLSVFPAAGVFNWTVLPPNTGVSPLTGTGPIFNPVFANAGNYIVQATETANTYCNSGATSPQQIKVTVISTPAPGIINGPVTACIGSNYNYTMSISAPSGYHYAWSITGGAGTFQPGNLATTTGNSTTIQWTTLPGTISVVLQANGYPPCPSAPVTLTVTQATVGNITGTMNVCVDGNGTYTLTGGTLPPGEIITWSITPSSQGTIISGQGTNSITVLWHGTTGVGPWTATINASTACGNATPLTGIMIYPKFTFTITKTGIDICQPGGITLTVTSAPSGATYLWSPGGQTTSSISNITTAGTYSVTVTKGGCSFTQTYVVEDPFAIIPVTCGVGTCNGTATNEALGVAVVKPLVGTFTYQWYSGTYPSGTLISGATSANYTTTTHGNFYVVVTYGTCSKYVSFTVKKVCCPDVNNPQITNVTRNSCNSYTFTGTTPNPTGASITWNFGDGNTATGVSGVPITHVYATAGVYCVTFCVGPPSPNPTNCTGNCAATTVTVPIQAAFLYTLGCNGCLKVTNISTVITSNPSYVTYLWNFGDGNTSTAQNPGQHCYTNPGTYTVTLTISYNDGQVSCTSTATHTVTYTALAITINPSPVCTGVPTTFSSTPGGFITYAWNFGDGFTAYTSSSTHIYNAAGNNTPVTLTVTDQLGNICTANSTINVLPGIGPCTIQPGFICPGGSATLSTPNVGGYTYLWEQETTPNVFVPAPGTNTNNIYTTTTPGFYHVVITGPNGCQCTSNKVEVKTVSKPKAIIAASPSSRLCGSGNVMLTSVNHLPGYTSDWYANGNYGSLLSSGQIYMAFGVTVTTVYNLILTNEYGCKDTCSLTVYVNPVPAQPVITSSPTLCEGVPITLTVTNYSNNITWNTGANTTSITVSAAGVYTATYTDPVTGCSSSKNIKINRRPPTDLFPHFCDKIPCTCRDSTGNFTIYAPQPLIGAFASNYNIQWYFNNSPVGTNGNNPMYSPAVSGTYQIVVTDQLTGCKDTSDTYSIVVPPCDTCDCKESKWGDIVLNPGDKPGLKTGNQPVKNNVPSAGSIRLECNKNYTLLCNQFYNINATYICRDTACPPKVTYTLQPPIGAAISGNVPTSFTPTMNGVYILTLYGWCGNKICDSCTIDFTVICEKECDCKGSKWGNKGYTTQNQSKPFDCNKTYPVKCNQPVTVNAGYICPDPNKCPASVTYTLQPPSGPSVTGNVPLTFTPNQTGTYTLTLYGWCGTAKCDSCIVQFKTECPVDTTCCPYPIKVDTSKLTYTYSQQYNATIAAQNFTISGLAGVPLTEVRAEVLSYTITDNYNKECMKCVNMPYTWASILSATNLGVPTVPPKITMYNSTVHPFNPTGAGLYQNPREVVWNNGSTFTINNDTQVGMDFILPPPPLIDCCELKGRICVKFTFRDKNCKECEVISCFEFLIKSKKPF